MFTKIAALVVAFFVFNQVACGQTTRWQKLEAEADTLMQQEQFEKAEQRYTNIIAGNAEKLNPKLYYKRGVCRYYLGLFESAIQDVGLFLKQVPEAGQAYILRGLCYRQMGDLDNQLSDIEKASELQIGNPQLIKWRGSLYVEKGEYAKGKDDLLLARTFEDDAELETTLGMAYSGLGNTNEAIKCFNQSIVLDVNYPPAYLYAGTMLMEAGKHADALLYFELLLRLVPDNESALFYKGMSLVELKREKEGCSCLRKAFDKGQDDALDYLKEYCYDVFK
ncbi:MAG: tetratricopeptide repeat protein [Flammeovirgaceae bacterium]